MIIWKYSGFSMLVLVITKDLIYLHVNVGDDIHNLCHIMYVNSTFEVDLLEHHWKEVLIKAERFSKQRGIKFSNTSLGASALSAGKKN